AEAGVWKVYPEVPEVLDKLRPRFELAVISNFDGRLRLILQHLGISKYFAHVFISSELGADKPDPEIFRRALKVMHLDANETLHVGDDLPIELPTRAGLHFVMPARFFNVE
ncbi:MAG: hydrolase, partial [Verrucomicrobia bacterium]